MRMTDEPDLVEVEIAQLRAEMKERQERINHLKKLRSHPAVVPVEVYFQHYHRYEEPHDYYGDEWDLVLSAYRTLSYGEDAGNLSAVGVEINGVLIERDELARRYPQVWQEIMAS